VLQSDEKVPRPLFEQTRTAIERDFKRLERDASVAVGVGRGAQRRDPPLDVPVACVHVVFGERQRDHADQIQEVKGAIAVVVVQAKGESRVCRLPQKTGFRTPSRNSSFRIQPSPSKSRMETTRCAAQGRVAAL
jgi:hypothetical protein